MTRTGLVDLGPLRTAAFRDSWLGSWLSGFGYQVAALAVLQQTWELTRSPLGTGAIGVATGIPMIVAGPIGGALADAMDRRRLARLASGLQLVAALGLVAHGATGSTSVPVLFGLVSLLTVGVGLAAPARRTFAARLLPATQVPAGIALTTVGFQFSTLAGPAVGGLLVAGWGFSAAYALEALTIAASLITTLRLPAMPPEQPDGRTGRRPAGVGRAAAGGWAYLFRRRILRGTFATDLAASLLAFPVSLFPMVNELYFGGDPRSTGMFLSALAVGGLAAGLLSGAVTRIRCSGAVQLVAAASWGVTLAGFGATGPLSGHLLVALGFLVLAGAADSISVITRGGLVQAETPDAYRGRVSSAELTVGFAGPELGNFRGGLVASLSSAPFALVSGGLAAVAVIAWIGLTNRPLREYRAPARPP